LGSTELRACESGACGRFQFSGEERRAVRHSLKALRGVARVTGLEPATSGVTGRHSNQLSYTRVPVRSDCAPRRGAAFRRGCAEGQATWLWINQIIAAEGLRRPEAERRDRRFRRRLEAERLSPAGAVRSARRRPAPAAGPAPPSPPP